MAVTFPAWFTEADLDDIPIIEDVMIARFDGLMGGVEPVYWIPTDEQTQQVILDDEEAFLRIYRVGGEVDLEERRIIHRVQFAAISSDRAISWRIVAFVQWVLYAYEDTSYVVMPDAAKVAVRFLGETLGPLLDPQLIRDERLVPWTVELETPWPKGLPIIREHLQM